MNNQELLEQIQEEFGLELVETTTGVNGYPRCLKYSLIGLESYEQIREILDKYDNVNTTLLHRRDGWQLWERHYFNVFSEKDLFQISDIYDFDRWTPYETKEIYEGFVLDDIKDSWDLEFNSWEEFESFLNEEEAKEEPMEDLEDLLEFYDRNSYGIEVWGDMKEDEIILRDSCGNYGIVSNKPVTSYYHDTHHYAIGIMINE